MRRWRELDAATRRWWAIVIGLTVAGTAARVAYIFLFRNQQTDLLPGIQYYLSKVPGDGFVYHKQANLLVEGKGLIAPLPYELKGVVQQAADHPPGYVLYLALFSLVGLRSELTHMLVSAPLGAMAALTFALVGRRMWSPRAGLIAGAIGAFAPSLLHYPGFILSESLTVPLLAAVALFLLRLVDRPTWPNAAWAGAWCGLAVLSHPDASLMVPLAIVPVVVLLRRTSWRAKLGLLAAAGVTCGALVLPWVGFNLARYEKPVYLSVGLDYSMAQGSCDKTYYGDLIGYYWLTCMGDRLQGTGLDLLDQSLGATYLHEQAMDYISAHKARTVLVVGARIGRVAGVFRPLQQASLETVTERREPWLSNLSVLTFYPFALLAIAGGVLARRRRVLLLPMVALTLEGFIGAAMTLAVLRYRVTAEIPLAVLTGIAVDCFLVWVAKAWREREVSEPALETAA